MDYFLTLEAGRMMEEVLTPFEQRFEWWRRSAGLILGPAAARRPRPPALPSLDRPAHTLAAILGWVVVWWITEPIPLPMTAVLGHVCPCCSAWPTPRRPSPPSPTR